MTTINWGQIVTNSLSLLVGSVFVGAGIIVWNAATTMDERIDEANNGIESSQEALIGTTDILITDLADLRTEVDALMVQIEGLRKVLAEAQSIASTDAEAAGDLLGESDVDPATRAQRNQLNLDRLIGEIEPIQMKVQTAE